ncbi:MAG: hypothetical protein HN366_04095 [Deltaproteobacteria bacterium]|nr:hypothetical protein [Deltaproteobacteria bacterium]
MPGNWLLLTTAGIMPFEQWIKEVGDARIVYFRQPDEAKPLGEQRNMSVAKAGGTYVTQWDDDDGLSEPERLEAQT